MAASVPLERARSLEPDKGSIREALGRAYFRSRALRQGRRGVRRAGRALPGERLRALLPRPLAREDRPPRGGAPPRRARGEHAPGPRGLPGVRETGSRPAWPSRAAPRWPRTATTASVIRPSRRSTPRSSASHTGMSACTQMSCERVQPKRTRRVWRFHQSSIQGSRSPAAWRASAWTRSRPSAIRMLASIGLAAHVVAGHRDAPLGVGEPPRARGRAPSRGRPRPRRRPPFGQSTHACARWCNG